MASSDAQLLASLDDEVIVEYGQFTLQEQPGSPEFRNSVSFRTDVIVASGTGGALLFSGGNDHYPAVRLELWSAEPPAAADAWEAIEQAQLPITSPTIRLRSLLGVATARAMELPSPGPYGIRCHVLGRAAAGEMGEATFAHGVEHWLIQLWPTHEARQ